MYCRYCGKELPKDSNFCPNCGKKQTDNTYGLIIRMSSFFNRYKKLLYVYLGWVIINLSLFLLSSPYSHRYDRQGNRYDYDLSDGLYPFDKSLGNILGGKDFNFSLINNIDAYDFSEFFLYTIIIPITIFGIVNCLPLLLLFLKKEKERYCQCKEANDRSAKVKPVVKKSVSLEQQVVETVCIKTSANGNKLDREIQSKETKEIEHYLGKRAVTDTSPEEMPLLLRFIGGVIDKLVILVSFLMAFFVVSFIDSPFTIVDKATAYHYVLGAIPSNYYYVEHYIIQEAGVDGSHEGVSDFYWHNNRRELQENPPHHGMLLNLDLTVTFFFIFWNLLYYFITELFLKASLGKFLTGGIVVCSNNRKINKRNILLRIGMGAFLMLYFVGLRFLVNTNYYVIIILFFYVMDLPLLLSKKSLLDILTGTFYGKRNRFLRSQDRVQKYQKRVFDGISKSGKEYVTIHNNEKEKKNSYYIWGCALALHISITIVAYCIYYFNPETIDVNKKWNYIWSGFGIGALSWLIAILVYRIRGKNM